MKTLLITGGSDGIGLELVKIALTHGDRVVTTYNTNFSNLKKLQGELLSREGSNLLMYQVDLADELSVSRFTQNIAQPLRTKKPYDVFIYNAGYKEESVQGRISPVALEKMRRVNALSPVKITGRLLEEKPDLKCVFVGSDTVFDIEKYPTCVEYAKTKQAQHNYVHFLYEKGFNVRSANLDPTKTRMTNNMGREVAEAARFLYEIATTDNYDDKVDVNIWEELGPIEPDE